MKNTKPISGDDLFELKEKISQEVHKLVDKMTNHLVPLDDEELRQTLTEQFRFWRQR